MAGLASNLKTFCFVRMLMSKTYVQKPARSAVSKKKCEVIKLFIIYTHIYPQGYIDDLNKHLIII